MRFIFWGILTVVISALAFYEFILKGHEIDHLVLPIVGLSIVALWSITYNTSFAATCLLMIDSAKFTSTWIMVYQILWHPFRHFSNPLGAMVWKTGLRWYRVQRQSQDRHDHGMCCSRASALTYSHYSLVNS